MYSERMHHCVAKEKDERDRLLLSNRLIYISSSVWLYINICVEYLFLFLQGYWGTPTFNSAFFVSMIAGVITSVIESIGDYYTCARLAGALPPPAHAVNRGILTCLRLSENLFSRRFFF